jgi:hypothetical protein
MQTTKEKVSEILETLLRGAFCAIWIFGTMMALLFALAASNADYDDPTAPFYWHRALGCLIVVALAGFAHGYLLWKKVALEPGERRE